MLEIWHNANFICFSRNQKSSIWNTCNTHRKKNQNKEPRNICAKHFTPRIVDFPKKKMKILSLCSMMRIGQHKQKNPINLLSSWILNWILHSNNYHQSDTHNKKKYNINFCIFVLHDKRTVTDREERNKNVTNRTSFATLFWLWLWHYSSLIVRYHFGTLHFSHVSFFLFI